MHLHVLKFRDITYLTFGWSWAKYTFQNVETTRAHFRANTTTREIYTMLNPKIYYLFISIAYFYRITDLWKFDLNVNWTLGENTCQNNKFRNNFYTVIYGGTDSNHDFVHLEHLPSKTNFLHIFWFHVNYLKEEIERKGSEKKKVHRFTNN